MKKLKESIRKNKIFEKAKKRVIIPISKGLGSFKPFYEIAISMVDDVEGITKIDFTTKDPDYFSECVVDFHRIFTELSKTNQISTI